MAAGKVRVPVECVARGHRARHLAVYEQVSGLSFDDWSG